MAHLVQNPFSGTGVASVTMTNVGAYQSGEQISFVSFSGGGGSGAIAYAQATVTSIGISNPGFGYAIGDILGVYAGIVIRITSVGGSGNILAIAIVNAGSLTSGQFTGGNPSGYTTNSGTGINATFNITWGITSVGVTTPGTGYSTPPAVIFTTGSSIQDS